MATTVLQRHQFIEAPAGALAASTSGMVFILDEAQPAHVLLPIAAYQELLGRHVNIADLLAMPGAEDEDFAWPDEVGSASSGGAR